MMAKIEWYEEILALEPGSKVFFPFAKRLAEDGLHDKALAVLRHGLVQHPEYLEARVFLSHLLFEIGDTQTAMSESQQVFARLAAYPAFWEALSLANEAVPGDMNLAMRFLAEGLRAPGLTLAAAMRRGLAPQGTAAAPGVADVAVVAELSEVMESSAVAEHSEVTELPEIADLTEAPEVSELAERAPAEPVEPLGMPEMEPLPENAPEPLLDPLAPVVDEGDSETEATQVCGFSGAVLCDALLPLDDEEPEQPAAVQPEETEEPAAELVVENAEAVLADAASVDEALAELDGALEAAAAEAEALPGAEAQPVAMPEELTDALPGTAAEPAMENVETDENAPPVLSPEELQELDKTLFGDPELASGEFSPAEPALEALESDSTVLADEISEAAAPAGEEADVEPSAANPLDAVLDEVLDEALVGLDELAELAESLTEPSGAEEAVESPEAAGAQPSPAIQLDDGLLGLDDEPDAADSEPQGAVESFAEPALPEPASPEPASPEPALSEQSSSESLDVEPASAGPDADLTEDDLPDDLADDEPVRTRSMADVLAEQGDIDGALVIYGELLKKAGPAEAASLRERMEALRGLKSVEKPEPRPAPRSDKAGLRSMLENLAGRLEKRAKADHKQ